MSAAPLIVKVARDSTVDGPGIRSVAFFKGCPLRCLFCHNPEAQDAGPDIALAPAKCIACGRCGGAIAAGGPLRPPTAGPDPARLAQYEPLAKTCPTGAIREIGQPLTPAELAQALLRDAPFHETSHGGVTLSGGECTMFPDYMADLLTRLKARDAEVAIETCGWFDYDQFVRRLLPLIDIIYFDIKFADSALHERFTGQPNARIIENFRRLMGVAREKVHPRIPLVPGITATPENLWAIIGLLRAAGATEAVPLPYNPLGLDMWEALGHTRPAVPDRFMDPSEEAFLRRMFGELGQPISLTDARLEARRAAWWNPTPPKPAASAMPALDDSFLVLSPNLGCPRLVALADIAAGQPLPLLVASSQWKGGSPQEGVFEGRFFLRPANCPPGARPPSLALRPAAPPQPLAEWDALKPFRDADDTWWLLSRELQYGVLGAEFRFWRLDLALEDPEALRTLLHGQRLMLFDLVWTSSDGGATRANLHCVQVMARCDGELRFLHVTDLHLARRNDQILAEVLKEACDRPAREIQDAFVNFNENFRRLVRHANELAEKGELDFIAITGDLVDFAHPGWRDAACTVQNNWKTFVDILAGLGEQDAGAGLAVAAYTSLGNHDWRLHPYPPSFLGAAKAFGLEPGELKHFPYPWFDSSKLRPDDPRRKEAEELYEDLHSQLNLGYVGRAKATAASLSLARPFAAVSTALFSFGSFLAAQAAGWGAAAQAAAVGAVGAGTFLLSRFVVQPWLRKFSDLVTDNLLHADATALSYYLKNINPYFDYAFRYGPHWFIAMDTGADVFTGQLLDGSTWHDLRKMSVEDNFIGLSPDSRAFESDCRCYDWSQIVWLENVLAAAHQASPGGRRILLLHAPPINTVKSDETVNADLAESKRKDVKGKLAWVPEWECNLTYGTINHYLSQFFYLCLGSREGHLGDEPAGALGQVDLVLSGHAHRNIEFRLRPGDGGDDKFHIFADRYSEDLSKSLKSYKAGDPARAKTAAKWWEEHRPVLVQTAGCGPKSGEAPQPPYFRRVTIGATGVIEDFGLGPPLPRGARKPLPSP